MAYHCMNYSLFYSMIDKSEGDNESLYDGKTDT